MNELNRKIYLFTFLLTIFASIIGFYFGIKIFISIWIGCITGLIGYYMVVRMVLNIPSNEVDGKKAGTSGYVKRYLFYGIVFVACQYLQLSLLGVLIGIMCNKAAILIYALKEKEDLHE